MAQCIFGDLAAFGFCQGKILTTGGEGGLLALDDEPMWRAAWDRQRVIDEIAAQGVPCYAGSPAEIDLEESFRDAGLAPAERFPIARELRETSLCFLS